VKYPSLPFGGIYLCFLPLKPLIRLKRRKNYVATDVNYVVNGRICRIDIEKIFTWTPAVGVSWADDPEAARHLAIFKDMKEIGFFLVSPIDATEATSYFWFEDVGVTRKLRVLLQRVVGDFDIDTLPNDSASQWTLRMYPQIKAAVAIDPYLVGARIMLYFGGQGGC
jgi:hypothetical protein